MAASFSPTTSNSTSDSPLESALPATPISARAALLSVALAFFFGTVIPIVDMKMRATFLGATHLPPGAIASLLVLLLIVNPLLHAISKAPAKQATLLLATLATAFLAGFLRFRGLESANVAFVFTLLCAVAAIGILVLLLGRKPLSRNETLVVYISCLFSCLTPGHGAENVFVVNLIGPFYYATRENKWLEFLVPYIKPWMTPALSASGGKYDDSAKDMISGWFLGTQNGQIPWAAWLVPLLVWTFFIFVLYVMMACLCVILRKQWTEREALSFPLLRLPMELTEGIDQPENGIIPGFFRNNLMWVGFGIAVFIQMLRGLHVYFPDVPDFPLSIDTAQLFTEAPWNQIGGAPTVLYPLFIGIAYLLTAEISFSLWFFFWFVKFQLIAAYYAGFPPSTLPNAIGSVGGGFETFTHYQQIGCYLAYVAIMFYTGREHFKHIGLRAFGRRRAGVEERDEALSYPAAFWGFFGSFALIIGWSIAAGIAPLLALVLWTLYLVIIIALTRLISEAGVLFVQQGWVPLGVLGQITGAGPNHWLLSQSSLPPAAMMQGALMTDLRGFIMPSFMQGFKLAFDRKIALKPLLMLVLLCSLVSMVIGVVMNVKLGYSQGGLTLDPWYGGSGGASVQPATASVSLVKGVTDASYSNLIWVGVGTAMTYGMMLARSRFAWFPLHPIGFLVSQSYPITQIWFSVFIGWGCKILVTRFGGTDTYRKTTPLFLGLALGDVAMMLFWLVIDGWQGQIGHKLMPG
ncbi:hypothetical protein B1R32_10898 [Abditibacterium utsteinense]|uniref:Peptide transporter n=1 Tax=Abditibacterium utsteinense TaxID=1960156 RepID=A0A2S8SSW4_9BACT|nr:DUF6785 family protein [Abditibacterium utsteinense]PQV63891.1 hypothetical protein B1R32_10898 [Abditibacterium utsteinense]